MKRPVELVIVPSGATMALTPETADTTTDRLCSTARSRDIASCCTLISLSPYQALLVGTTSSSAPSRTASWAG